jgi:signal transduction histidine kinase
LQNAVVVLENSFKFTPTGPTGQIELGAEQVDQAIHFWVKDNGIGIPSADQARIFERFYRGQNVRETTGSGLGLAIVQRIVEAHGGRISVQSALNVGSRFTIELPLIPL